ncbi:MAG: hypothetical protein JOZ22_15125 [Acidobacteriia bacterium]|nr:hypothetical protein [Terriglobia bacterium]
MKKYSGLVVAGLGMLLPAVPAMAHHSFAAEFDNNKPVTLKGSLTRIDWMNPHIWIYLDVKDDAGAVTHWQCEGGPPNSLTRNGWTKDALKIGDQVTVEGFKAKDGTNTCNSRSVKLPDGRSVFAGSADDGGPGRRSGGTQ